MRKIIFTALILGLVALVSCKKDKETNDGYLPNPVPVPSYFPMAIGNYWVYENHEISNGELEIIEQTDSIIISNDTLIGDFKYYIFESYIHPYSGQHINYLRDSSNYIIDISGQVHFTTMNPGEQFGEKLTINEHTGDTTLYFVNYLELVEKNIEFPIGDLNAISMFTNYIILPQSGLGDSLTYRSFESHFVDGVGRASNYLFYASGSKTFEKKLLRYHIEEQP